MLPTHGQCHSEEGCSCVPSLGLSQELDELEFERGIWAAALDGDLDKVKRLLQKSKDEANAQDKSGYTALHYAARNGHGSVVDCLIEAGADVNSRTPTGLSTPLHRAAYRGYCHIVRKLLETGADGSLCDSDGRNVLHKAAEGGKEEVVKYLLEKGAGRRSGPPRLKGLNPSLSTDKDVRGRTARELIPSNRDDILSLFEMW